MYVHIHVIYKSDDSGTRCWYNENAYVVSKYIMKQLGLCFHYRDSRWGVRDVDDVEHLAEQNKMSLIKTVSAY